MPRVRCWMSERAWRTRRDIRDAAADERIAREGDGSCLLDDGHDGDHVFTPNRSIVIEIDFTRMPS